jgi:integral membrane protein (TIGR01906 family)
MPGGRLGAWLIATATALVLLGGSILPFLTPAYVRLEQERSGVHFEGLSTTDMDRVAGSLLGDLFLWQGDFDVSAASGAPVLNDRERAHKRDVRGVFVGFELLVLGSVVALAIGFRRARDAEARAAAWRVIGRGARGLAVGLIVVGAFAALAFDAAFEVFHRLFFGAGTYTFDPRTDHLVQLFPEQFWSDTTLAIGIVALGAAILTAWRARRRAGLAAPSPVLAASKART